MTKLLGTIVSFFMLTNIMAQQPKQVLQKLSSSDSLKKYTDSIRNLPPLEVKSIRANEQGPFAKSNISKNQIALLNTGQDLPFILQNTPSVVVHADAGNGVGYTGIRIRGTDATRINFTLNGIPYNDPESMGTFFVNLPDFSSSVNSIQIQRGVGTSSNGAGAFGGTVNLSTNEYNPNNYISFQNSGGSFNTLKNTLLFGTGLLNNHWTLDARLSKIVSDGYIDRASSDLKSYFVSTTYWGEKSSLRFNIFSGKEKTYQAWYGVPEELLSTNRTYNPAGTEKLDNPYEDQVDNYKQTHYQVFYNKEINKKLQWNTALFTTLGKGYYEEYKSDVDLADYNIETNGKIWVPTDIVRRRWLDNQFYGQIAAISYKDSVNELTGGGGWTVYDGLHFGTLPYLTQNLAPTNFKYYDVDAKKSEINSYVKWERYWLKNMTSFIDLQFRNVQHKMNGFKDNPLLFIDRKFAFFNPKMGFRVRNKSLTYFTSIAFANKEPNREDFEANKIQQPKSEKLIDWETGLELKKSKFLLNANMYYMHYKDQLVLTGKINDVGAYTRTNVPSSYRAGIELQAQYSLSKKYSTSYSVTLSQNKIKKFTEYIDDYDNGGQISIEHNNTNIALSPSLITNRTFQWRPNERFALIWTTKYVSKQYLDNTQNNSKALDDYFLNDINAHWQIIDKTKWKMKIQFFINNILDIKYEPNGYTYSYIYSGSTTTSNNYFPMAGRNYWLSLLIDIK
jgi:iron complex outermembrane receptor protein